MNSYLFYYNNYKLQNKIIPYLIGRETAIISSKLSGIPHFATRMLRIHNTQSFQFWLKFLRMFEARDRTYNLYYSMAKFRDGIPFRNTKGGNIKEDFKEWNDKAGGKYCVI